MLATERSIGLGIEEVEEAVLVAEGSVVVERSGAVAEEEAVLLPVVTLLVFIAFVTSALLCESPEAIVLVGAFGSVLVPPFPPAPPSAAADVEALWSPVVPPCAAVPPVPPEPR